MQDCEELTALKRVKAFLGGFVDRSENTDGISLGLRFIYLDEQQPEDSQDDNIVGSPNAMSASDFPVEKQQPEDSEDDNIVESTNSMSDSDFSVDSKAIAQK